MTTATTTSLLLKGVGIHKEFPGVKALQNVEIDLNRKEVLALVGENGAGKSTLIKILSGLIHMDAGTLLIDGEKVEVKSPAEAKKLGISAVQQDPHIAPNLTVLENLFLGNESTYNKIFPDKKEMERKGKEVLARLGTNLDLSADAKNLSPHEVVIVAIAEALLKSTRILILDEVTARLNPSEVDKLVEVIDTLKQEDIGIMFVTHRLNEVFQIADKVKVLRDGQDKGSYSIDEINQSEVVEKMVGESKNSVEMDFGVASMSNQPVLLTEGLCSSEGECHDVDLKVFPGEIVGLAGLRGSGKSELLKTLFGAKKYKGKIFRNGEEVHLLNPKNAIEKGISYIPSDRHEKGLFANRSVSDNINVTKLSGLTRVFDFIDFERYSQSAKKLVEDLDIRTPSITQAIQYLSGGNQQKAMISRWLGLDWELLLCDEPTRGIDVAAEAEIWKLLNRFRTEGKSILVSSTDISELTKHCDRIYVMKRGTLGVELERSEFSEKRIRESLEAT